MSDLIITGVNAPRRSRVRIAIIVLFVVVALLFVVRTVINARELQLRLVCGSNLKGLATTFKIYSRENDWDEKKPPIEWLITKGYIEPRQAICPSSGGLQSNYILVPPPAGGWISNNAIMAFEPKSNHGDGGNVVFADGHAAFLRGDDYDKLIGPLSTGPK